MEGLRHGGSSCAETELEIKLAGLANGKGKVSEKERSQDHTLVLPEVLGGC